MTNYKALQLESGFADFPAFEHYSASLRGVDVIFYDGKRRRITPDYAVTGWGKALRIVDGTFENEAECA
jgi:hypothetical protein